MPNEKPSEDIVELNLRWPLEDDIQAVYSNQFAIAHPGPEVILTFGAFLPSSFSNRSDTEVREFLKNAQVNVVAKIIVSPQGLQAFYNLLTSYMERISEKGKQEGQ